MAKLFEDRKYVVHEFLDRVQPMTGRQVMQRREYLERWGHGIDLHVFDTAEDAKEWMLQRAVYALIDLETLVRKAKKRVRKCTEYVFKETKQ